MANDSDINTWDLKREDLAGLPRLNGLRSPGSKFSLPDSRTARGSAKRSSASAAEVRFINPAIYAESFDADDSVEAPPSAGFDGDFALAERLSGLSVNEVDFAGDQPADTYRCRSVTPSTLSSLTLTNSSKSVTRVERRCAILGEPGNQEVHRKIAHEEWVRKKRQAALDRKEHVRRSELRKKMEEKRLAEEKEERENREQENFQRWADRKREEEESRRKAVEQELELQRRLKMLEDTAVVAKTVHLRQWARNKEDVHKAQQKEQREKRKEIDEERIKRLEESSMAYEKWREKSKNKPKPATQGLLPHQKATPAYVNPQPWQQIVDEVPDESQKASADGKASERPKRRVRKSIASHQ